LAPDAWCAKRFRMRLRRAVICPRKRVRHQVCQGRATRHPDLSNLWTFAHRRKAKQPGRAAGHLYSMARKPAQSSTWASLPVAVANRTHWGGSARISANGLRKGIRQCSNALTGRRWVARFKRAKARLEILPAATRAVVKTGVRHPDVGCLPASLVRVRDGKRPIGPRD